MNFDLSTMSSSDRRALFTERLSRAGHKSLLNDLPESMVAFETHGLKNATVLFRNERLNRSISNSEILNKYAFACRSHDLRGFLDARRKTFNADRYGGVGLIHNGGSGRCGCDDQFQVKGIGRTPLVGRDVAEKYSSGKISLHDAILEAAYGEISNAILPFGSVRSVAILGTNTLMRRNDGKSVPRALLVREAALRPAHFDRAVYFWPQRRFLAAQHIRDSDRTAAAIQRLPKLLQRELLAEKDEFKDVSDIIISGLTTFAERLASQVAAAQAKRMMHGSMATSNIALDGRWLDFGATTCLPLDEYGAHSNYLPFWHEADTVLRGLKDILFFAQKYIPEFRPACSHALSSVSASYLVSLSRESRLRQLSLTGVPLVVLRRLSTQEPSIDTLTQAFLKIGKMGFAPTSAELKELSDSRVGAVALILSKYFSDPTCADRLRPYISNAVQPEELIDVYRIFIRAANAAANALGVAPSNFMRATRINALRFARYPDFMYRPKLAHLVDKFLTASSDDVVALSNSITNLLHTVQDQSEALVADSEDLTVTLWVQGTTFLVFNMFQGVWHFTDDSQTWKHLSCSEFEKEILPGPLGNTMRAHFPPDFMKFIR